MYRMLRQSALAVSRAGPRSGRVRSGQVVPAPSEVDGTGFEALSVKLCQLCVSHTGTQCTAGHCHRRNHRGVITETNTVYLSVTAGHSHYMNHKGVITDTCISLAAHIKSLSLHEP